MGSVMNFTATGKKISAVSFLLFLLVNLASSIELYAHGITPERLTSRLIFGENAAPTLRLDAPFSDGVILQRNQPIPIRGKAFPLAEIEVLFKGKKFKGKADQQGRWEIRIGQYPAGGPFEMTVTSRVKRSSAPSSLNNPSTNNNQTSNNNSSSNKNPSSNNKSAGQSPTPMEGEWTKETLRLRDVWIGEVWLCSGQSNMVHQIDIHDIAYAKNIVQDSFPLIRQFLIPTRPLVAGPADTFPATIRWEKAIKEGLRPFSAVAYFFARKIHLETGMAIGLVNASVGGTPIEAWIGEKAFEANSPYFERIQEGKDSSWLLPRLFARSTPPSFWPEKDPATTADTPWFHPDYIPQNWRTFNLPGYWEDQGLVDLNGIVWFRKEFWWDGTSTDEARLLMGRIVDADETFLNGVKIGQTSYQYPQRRYKVPKGLLKKGKNVITVRVANQSGKGGFVPDKPYQLCFLEDTLQLDGIWQYKVAQIQLPNAPQPNKPNTAPIALQNHPTALFNGMISPLQHFPIAGVCWYQGESNAGQPKTYETLMKNLIRNWRSLWKNEQLPFLYVQLPGFMDYQYLPTESNWAEIRQAQLNCLSVPNTGMAVAIDLGEWNDIHPDNKKDVGERLALIALHQVYRKSIDYSGPLPLKAEEQNGKIVISFTQVGNGLRTTNRKPPTEFALAGPDGKFHWAEAAIENNRILLHSPKVPHPTRVRYAWSNNPVAPNLTNHTGLPATPFELTILKTTSITTAD